MIAGRLCPGGSSPVLDRSFLGSGVARCVLHTRLLAVQKDLLQVWHPSECCRSDATVVCEWLGGVLDFRFVVYAWFDCGYKLMRQFTAFIQYFNLVLRESGLGERSRCSHLKIWTIFHRASCIWCSCVSPGAVGRIPTFSMGRWTPRALGISSHGLMACSWFDSGYMFMGQFGRSSWVQHEGGLWILRRVLSARDARTWKSDIFSCFFWQCSVYMSPQEYLKIGFLWKCLLAMICIQHSTWFDSGDTYVRHQR